MRIVCDKMNLSWGKTGKDTYLVVRRAPKTLTAKNLSLDIIINGERVFIGPDGKKVPPTQTPKNWQPFGFNGQTYYVVPTMPRAQ